ncbi:MAG: UDP-N-acetylmuramoyl-tripeptide--D-alanyl-D-alanine ligase [Myxococcales bacterium]
MATPIPRNQVRFTLAEIAAATGGRLLHGDPESSIEGVTIDSRAVVPGNLFVAIRGGSQDGARFLPQAISSGAHAVLVQTGTNCPQNVACIEVRDTTYALGDLARFHRKRWGGLTVAITGSAGKTTTKELTAAALTGIGKSVLKSLGNLNNQFGVPMMVFCLSDLHDTAVFEVGTSGRGEIARLGEIVQPDVAVVLLAALAHTAGIGTLADVADEKASLWGSLGPEGVAIVNADDTELNARVRTDVTTLAFGRAPDADVRLLSSSLSLWGTQAKLEIEGFGELDLSLPLVGHAAALDAAAALAVVLALKGVSALPPAAAGLGQVQQTAGRMVPYSTPDGVYVIDDSYNANPHSTAVSLEALAALAKNIGGHSIAVLGDMKELGSDSLREHSRVGELAVKLGVDVLIGTGPEMAHGTAAAARLSAGRLAPHPTRVVQLFDPLHAVAVVKSLWRPGDVVLVKGSRSTAMERVVRALCEEEKRS